MSKSIFALTLLTLFLVANIGNAAVKVEHPRIWINDDHLHWLKAKVARSTPDWQRLKQYVDGKNHYGEAYLLKSYAAIYLVTEQETYGREAIKLAIEVASKTKKDDMNKTPPMMTSISIVYDWCYPLLRSREKETLIEWLNGGYEELKNSYQTPWHNYAVSIMLATGLAGYATLGDNPKAQELINYMRIERFENKILPALRFAGDGGGWPESSMYGGGTILRLVQYLEAVLTATGEDLYSSANFFKDRLAFMLFNSYPGIHERWGKFYRQLYIHGDGGRWLKGTQGYVRATTLMLIKRFPNIDMARYAQDWVSEPPVDKTPHDWMAVDDFLWYNQQAPSSSRLAMNMPLAYHVTGIGTVYMRSDWTPDATWVSFQCGDHFEYHQHLDQNSFTIFKGDDLAVDSGVYNWANSGHANNYYARTIAHNSILVFDPAEQFSWEEMRGGYEGANDGGQRAWKFSKKDKASWCAQSVEYWKEYKHLYDTGDIVCYEDTRDYTYMLGDATNAYRPDKVTNFTRQLLFIRPNHILVFDRVSSANSTFAKKWLLHCENEPQSPAGEKLISDGEYELRGDLVFAVKENGKLFAKTVLPRSFRITKIGGKDIKDCWVDGKNYGAGKETYGKWRLEVQPTVKRKDDVFFHVLYAANSATNSMPVVQRIEAGNMAGVQLEDYVALFSLDEKPLSEVQYRLSGQGRVKNIICDVIANAIYNVSVDNNQPFPVRASTNCVLTFDLPLKGTHIINVTRPNSSSVSRTTPTQPGKPIHWDD